MLDPSAALACERGIERTFGAPSSVAAEWSLAAFVLLLGVTVVAVAAFFDFWRPRLDPSGTDVVLRWGEGAVVVATVVLWIWFIVEPLRAARLVYDAVQRR